MIGRQADKPREPGVVARRKGLSAVPVSHLNRCDTTSIRGWALFPSSSFASHALLLSLAWSGAPELIFDARNPTPTLAWPNSPSPESPGVVNGEFAQRQVGNEEEDGLGCEMDHFKLRSSCVSTHPRYQPPFSPHKAR